MKGKFWRVVVGLGMLFGASVRADEGFERALVDYHSGRFEEAAEGFEKVLERDGPRVSVLQNLGSAYHQLGQEGRAILALERALLLAPRDPDLQANLKRIRDEAAVFTVEKSDRWSSWRSRLSWRKWSQLAVLGAVMMPMGVLLGWAWSRKPGRWIALPVGVLGGLVAVGSSWMLRGWDEVTTRAVVIGGPATMRISPFETAQEKGSLPAGREVRLGEQKGDWFWVTVDGTASQGWLAKDSIEPVVPRRE
ncbi:hypothetical protein HNR46_001507 [Haloferula luteola]|uniref:Tetratricopeptide repeat protein n=1 Tax=Haloferula luteola TaxID=595692 RepID=A0A840VEM0_9BACT|nr:tetratricopeptide repeat protein [Haloferula luteola]MBB5351271.1 hypothetical protein [Haloferula luteola]